MSESKVARFPVPATFFLKTKQQKLKWAVWAAKMHHALVRKHRNEALADWMKFAKGRYLNSEEIYTLYSTWRKGEEQEMQTSIVETIEDTKLDYAEVLAIYLEHSGSHEVPEYVHTEHVRPTWLQKRISEFKEKNDRADLLKRIEASKKRLQQSIRARRLRRKELRQNPPEELHQNLVDEFNPFEGVFPKGNLFDGVFPERSPFDGVFNKR